MTAGARTKPTIRLSRMIPAFDGRMSSDIEIISVGRPISRQAATRPVGFSDGFGGWEFYDVQLCGHFSFSYVQSFSKNQFQLTEKL